MSEPAERKLDLADMARVVAYQCCRESGRRRGARDWVGATEAAWIAEQLEELERLRRLAAGWLVPEAERPAAMLLANVEEKIAGGWAGMLRLYTAGTWGAPVWRCEHVHRTRKAAAKCARNKWLEHHG